MERIRSFEINHDILEPGLYVSRVDGDIHSYDLRFFKPNQKNYFTTASAHTIEHLFATYVRNSKYSDQIVYVGPMGCRTGFYFLTRDTLSKQTVLDLLQETFLWISNFTGKIPGNQKIECGNYLDHDLQLAIKTAQSYYKVLKTWSTDKFAYNK